jgi:transcriptional regulator
MKITVPIIERTYGSVEIDVPEGMSKEEIEELVEEKVDEGEVEIEYTGETYREYCIEPMANRITDLKRSESAKKGWETRRLKNYLKSKEI